MLDRWWDRVRDRRYRAVAIVVVVLIAVPAALLGPRLLKDDGDGADAPEEVGAVERSVRSWLRDRAQAMLDPRGLPAWEEPNFKGPPCERWHFRFVWIICPGCGH